MIIVFGGKVQKTPEKHFCNKTHYQIILKMQLIYNISYLQFLKGVDLHTLWGSINREGLMYTEIVRIEVPDKLIQSLDELLARKVLPIDNVCLSEPTAVEYKVISSLL